MNRISDRTTKLLQDLETPPGLIPRLFGALRHPSAAALEEIAASRELGAAVALLPIALQARGELRVEVLRTIDVLVRTAPPTDLVSLDEHARETPPWNREAWAYSPVVSPEAVSALGVAPASALGVAALHRSGWVRAAAVQALGSSPDPLAVAFLLIRANDWVDPVRSAAVAALERRLGDGQLGPFFPFLDLVFRLEHVRRNDLTALVRAVQDRLVSPEGADALKGGCRSPTRSVRRRCLGLAFDAGTFDLRELVSSTLEDPDPLIRALGARQVGRVFDGEPLRDLVERMRRHRTAMVRCIAIELISERIQDRARAALEEALVDRHPLVRGTAAWLLRSDPTVDLATFYRAVLQDAPQRALPGALEGLGDTGSPADAELVAGFLSHTSPRVRLGAAHALGKLAPAEHQEQLLRALSDPSAKVARAARDGLRRARPVDGARLISATLTLPHVHSRRAAVDLMDAHDHWAHGLLLLQVLARGDGAVAERAEAAFDGWELRYNRVFLAPTQEQVAEYRALLEALPSGSRIQSRMRSLLPALETRIAHR